MRQYLHGKENFVGYVQLNFFLNNSKNVVIPARKILESLFGRQIFVVLMVNFADAVPLKTKHTAKITEIINISFSIFRFRKSYDMEEINFTLFFGVH